MPLFAHCPGGCPDEGICYAIGACQNAASNQSPEPTEESIEVQQATFSKYTYKHNNTVILVLWHDKGRTILTLDDDGAFRPLDTDSGAALVDLLKDLA